jgi:glycosyltransferase involved in cell wall biosynthesis
MRILINAISAKAGGIVTYTTNLIAALDRRGVDFVVAVPESFPEAPHLLRVPASNYGPARRLAWEQTIWRGIIRNKHADVLFSSANFGLLGSPVPQILLMREGGLFDPLYLATVAPTQGLHAASQRYLRRLLMLLSARANDHILTPTQAMRDMLLAWAPDLADRCTVNSYGTLVETFQPVRRRAWREDGVLRTLYVSVYYPHKNPSDVVIACEQLSAEGMKATMRLTMDLDTVRKVRGSARDVFHLQRGIAAGLVGMGAVTYQDLPATYADHDVFIFSSVSETFGHPMIEALACGIPVVAADVPVNREVLGDAALYFEPFRPSALADCLRRLDADPELRARMVAEGRRRATNSFNWDDHVDRLLDLFKQMARSRMAA